MTCPAPRSAHRAHQPRGQRSDRNPSGGAQRVGELHCNTMGQSNHSVKRFGTVISAMIRSASQESDLASR
jgi:hypothetical protein